MSILLLLVALLMVVVILTLPSYNQKRKRPEADDALYPKLYDSIHGGSTSCLETVEEFVPESARLLDAGCGTGALVNALKADSVGMDISKDMVAEAKRRYPDKHFIVSDVLERSTFRKETFTHIVCLGYSVYWLSSKLLFFKNCNYWLEDNGILILHVAANPKKAIEAPQYERNFKYRGNFVGNTYVEHMEYKNKSARVENKLHFESIETITKLGESSGFVLKQVLQCGASDNSSLLQVWVKSDFPLKSWS